MSKIGSEINALIVGVGNFGRHYARILSQLNGKGLAGIPRIDKLIVTRTRLERAQEVVRGIRNFDNCSVNELIGAKVNGTREVAELIEEYEPQFIGITARDKELGDAIHAVYTRIALNHGIVLCEKPFSNATGDGSSLRYFKELSLYEKADLFGLELPLAVVLREMMQNRYFQGWFRNCKNMEFHWERSSSVENDIIDDLVLHPWSLLPQDFKTETVEVDHKGTEAEILMLLSNEATSRMVPCKITLREGGSFRGFMIDNHIAGIKREGTSISLIQLNESLEEAAREGRNALHGDVLLEVENPLEQTIVASLRSEPTVGLARAYESQIFLERLHGYQPLPSP